MCSLVQGFLAEVTLRSRPRGWAILNQAKRGQGRTCQSRYTSLEYRGCTEASRSREKWSLARVQNAGARGMLDVAWIRVLAQQSGGLGLST